MSELKDTLAGLREALNQEAGRSAPPSMRQMLHRDDAAGPRRLLWAMAVASLMGMIAVPVFQGELAKRTAKQEQADLLFFEEVNESLSQPVAAALTPLLGPGN